MYLYIYIYKSNRGTNQDTQKVNLIHQTPASSSKHLFRKALEPQRRQRSCMTPTHWLLDWGELPTSNYGYSIYLTLLGG